MWACVCVYVCACVRVCDLPISARILPVPSLPSPISRHPPSCSTSLPPLQRPQDRPSIRQVLRHPFITRRNQILHDLQQGTSPGQGTASSSHALHPAHEHVGNGNSGAGARRHGEHAGAPASLTHGHRNAVLQHQHAGNSASATTTTSRASNSRSPPHRHHAHVPAKTTATTTTTTTTTTTAAAATAAATTTRKSLHVMYSHQNKCMCVALVFSWDSTSVDSRALQERSKCLIRCMLARERPRASIFST